MLRSMHKEKEKGVFLDCGLEDPKRAGKKIIHIYTLKINHISPLAYASS